MLKKISYPTRNSSKKTVSSGNLKEKPSHVREGAGELAWRAYNAPGDFKRGMSDAGRRIAGTQDVTPGEAAVKHSPAMIAAAIKRRKASKALVTKSGAATTPSGGSRLGRMGTLGAAATAAYAAHAHANIRQGYQDRMEQIRAREADEAPKTSTKKVEAPATAKPKATKKPTVKAPAKPKQGASNANAAADQEQMIDPIEARKQHFQQRLSAITMAKSPAPTATANGAGKRTARESAVSFFHNLLEAKRLPTEKKMRKEFKSKADITMRKGTPVTHTFFSNDRQHIFRGNPLAMRQKILAEHKRKAFPLKPGFENYDPIKVGEYFDHLSDRGMLDRERKELDSNPFRIGYRKTSRVGGRLYRKAKAFLTGLVTPKKEEPKAPTVTKESVAEVKTFCDFSVGNVKYPHDCGCSACSSMLESSATSFGQNMQPGAKVPNIQETIDNNHNTIITRLLNRKKRRKQTRVRESYEDSKHNAMLAREMQLHKRMGAGSRDIPRRAGTYFDTFNALRKFDRLGMNIATTALVLNGLAPAAKNLMQLYKADAAKAAGNVQQVFRGIPVQESESFRDHVKGVGDNFAKRHPNMRDFVDAPWDTVKNAAHSTGIRAAVKVGEALGKTRAAPIGRFIGANRYPIGKALGYGGLVAGAYVGKKALYDPIRRRAKGNKISGAVDFTNELRSKARDSSTF